MVGQPALRRATRAAALLALRPVQAAHPQLRTARHRGARQVLAQRIRLAALLVGSVVELDLDPGAQVSAALTLDVWPGTRSAVQVGPGARLWPGVLLSLRGGRLEVGAGTDIRRGVVLLVGGDLRLGPGGMLGQGVYVHCDQQVEVGALTIMGEYTTLSDSVHRRTPPGVPVHHAIRAAPVAVGANVWVGAHATIGAGVTVGDQAVVGAGAVVLDDVPAGWLAAGVPARLVRELRPEEEVELSRWA